MKKLHLLCALAVIAVLLSGCAEMNRAPSPPAPSASPVLDRILSRGELRVGMSGDMPPLNMLTKEDKIIGLDADLAAMVADAMGVKLNVQKIAFAGLLPALEAGSIDMIISNMTMTPDRNLKVAFVGPYFTSGKGLLTKNSTLAQAKKFEDINNPKFTFVALKGSTSEAVTRARCAPGQTGDRRHGKRRRQDGDRRQGRRHAGRLSHLRRGGLPQPGVRPGPGGSPHHL